MNRKKFGEILVTMGALSAAEVDRILTAMDRRVDPIKFGQLARKMGLIDDEQILAALAVQIGLVSEDLQRDMRQVLGELAKPGKAAPAPPRRLSAPFPRQPKAAR